MVLFKPVKSDKFATIVSTSPTPVVNAAMVNKKKNNKPMKMPPGNKSIILGMVTNNNPVPAFGAILKANSAGKITRPATKAINVSSITTQAPSETKLDVFGFK